MSKTQKTKKEDVFNIEGFIVNGPDDSKQWKESIKKTKSEIKKLKPNKWNKEYYSVRKEEHPIEVFGHRATLVKYYPYRFVFEKDACTHKKQWCPYRQPSPEYWVHLKDKKWKTSIGGLWYMEKIKSHELEQDLLHRTPEYKKMVREIGVYAEKEIKKVVEYLEKKYPHPEVQDIINQNTNPDYWY